MDVGQPFTDTGKNLIMSKKWIVLGAVLIWVSSAFGQSANADAPARRVSLSAQAQVQVAQDNLSVLLTTTREGLQAQTVQSQLKTALDAALVSVRRDTSPGLMDIHTGRFGLSPRYGRDGQISAWQGSAELVLEGSDFLRITTAAARVPSMTVARVAFGLSRAQRQQAQAQAQTQAIALFRQRASEIAQAFEATGYTVDDVHVRSDDTPPQARMEMMAARAMADNAPIPVEAGLTTVSVTVEGSVRLQ